MSRTYSMIAIHEGHREDGNTTAAGGAQYSTVPQVNTQDFLDLLSIYHEPDIPEGDDEDDNGDDSLGKQRYNSHRHSLLAVNTSDVLGLRRKEVFRRMQYLTCVAAIGGFLSGYNTGVISGALLPLTRVFHLSPFQEESIVSATILFAFCSSMIGGLVNQYCGRRRTILAAAAIFTCGGIFIFGAQNYSMLVLGEIILGVGIGLESLTNPMYISEVSKPDIRGMLVSAYAWMMCFGQFFAGIVDGVFGPYASGWRFMFGTAALPGTLMFVGFLGLPESPAWLVSIGQEKQAKEILMSFRDTDQDAIMECDDIKESLRRGEDTNEEVSPSVWQLFRKPSLRRALVVGCSLMLLQQFCGANVVMYYSATVYRMSGFSEVASLWLSAFTALAQLIGLALSLTMVEKYGRRPLVLISFAGVAICLMGLGASFYLARILSEPVNPTLSDPECMVQPALVWDGISKYCYDCSMIEGCGFCGGACVKGGTEGPFLGDGTCPANSEWQYSACVTPPYVGWMPVLFMVLYLIVFGIGAAGLPWTINSEIYPVKYRSLCVSFSTGANWLCNLVISSTFLSISHPGALTLYGSFWMYSGISILGVVWLYFVLPETKGLSYDQIAKCFGYVPPAPSVNPLKINDEEMRFFVESGNTYGSTVSEMEEERLHQPQLA